MISFERSMGSYDRSVKRSEAGQKLLSDLLVEK